MSQRHPFEIIKEHHKRSDENFLRSRYDDVERINEQAETDTVTKDAVEFALKNATYWEANPEENEIVINVSAFGADLFTITVPYDVDSNDSSKVSVQPASEESLDSFGERLLKRVHEHSW